MYHLLKYRGNDEYLQIKTKGDLVVAHSKSWHRSISNVLPLKPRNKIDSWSTLPELKIKYIFMVSSETLITPNNYPEYFI